MCFIENYLVEGMCTELGDNTYENDMAEVT